MTTGSLIQMRSAGFRRLDTWQADLAAALTVRGRSVHVTPKGIMATPPAAED